MITTWDIKQKLREVFTVGSQSASEVILILGSCRTVPYLNYLNRYNESAGQPFLIHFIEPFNYHWNERDEPVDIEKAITELETDARILEILRTTTIFIHEHYGNFGMFNTSRDSEKNIYQFGIAPRVDISIPNFHDHFILHDDFKAFGELTDDWVARGEASVEKFCALCELTSFPEFGGFFSSKWRDKRFFWTPNHISSEFSLRIFRLMNDKFLHLPLPPNHDFWKQAGEEDMFATPCTEVTQHDRDAYQLTWNP